mgnify:CR=1 FL=1
MNIESVKYLSQVVDYDKNTKENSIAILLQTISNF